MSNLTPKQLRESLGLPRLVIAARAGVCELTVRSYENNTVDGVTEKTRAKLEPVYAALAAVGVARG